VVPRRLIENDILAVDTGCVAVANAKTGYKVPPTAELAGPGLKEIRGALPDYRERNSPPLPSSSGSGRHLPPGPWILFRYRNF
jgi:hypothetical protein